MCYDITKTNMTRLSLINHLLFYILKTCLTVNINTTFIIVILIHTKFIIIMMLHINRKTLISNIIPDDKIQGWSRLFTSTMKRMVMVICSRAYQTRQPLCTDTCLGIQVLQYLWYPSNQVGGNVRGRIAWEWDVRSESDGQRKGTNGRGTTVRCAWQEWRGGEENISVGRVCAGVWGNLCEGYWVTEGIQASRFNSDRIISTTAGTGD